MKNLSNETDKRAVAGLNGTIMYLSDVGELKEEFDDNCVQGLANFSRLIDDTIEYKMHQVKVMEHLGTLVPNADDHRRIELEFK
jgi:hypothetical protein